MSLLLALTGSGGAYTITAEAGSYVVSGQQAFIIKTSLGSENSGGWFPNVRRKTRKEVYAERVKLGILPATVKRAAETVAKEIEVVPKRITPDLQKLMMAELKVTKWAPDYSRAIELALKVRQMEQDDEDVLLLM